jgi:lysophospholipase L1-like esterase
VASDYIKRAGLAVLDGGGGGGAGRLAGGGVPLAALEDKNGYQGRRRGEYKRGCGMSNVRVLLLGAAVLVLLLFGAPQQAAQANTPVYADTAGSCNGFVPCFTVIQDALNAAGPGPSDVIIFPGVYEENVVLDSSPATGLRLVTVDGTGIPTPGSATVAPASGAAMASIVHFAGDVTIDGLILLSRDDDGLRIDVEGLSILNVVADGNGDDGFEFSAGTLTISGSHADGNAGYGFNFGAGDTTIADTTADGNTADGFSFGAGSLDISDASANDNGGSGFGFGAGDTTIADTTADSNTADGFNFGAGNLNISDASANDNGGSGFNFGAGDAVIADTTADGNAADGFNFGASRTEITASSAVANGGSGLNFGATSVSLESVSAIANNSDGMVFGVSGGIPELSNGVVCGNGAAGLHLVSPVTMDAELNWWGDASGPSHPSNAGGTGDEVLDGANGGLGVVDFDPWITLDPGIPCSGAPADADNDGVPDAQDACPGTPAGQQVDVNGCSQTQVDQDLDSVCDPGASSLTWCTGTDNCPSEPNADQADRDGDSVGDACDPLSVYSATGDSYPNGADLAGPGDADRSRAYPQLFANILRERVSESSFLDYSCSGATTSDYINASQCNHTEPQLDLALSHDPDLVTVTIGANDFLGRLHDECVLGTFARGAGWGRRCAANVLGDERAWNRLENRLKAIVASYLNQTNAQIILTTYPFPGGLRCNRAAFAAVVPGPLAAIGLWVDCLQFNRQVAPLVHERLIDRLNGIIESIPSWSESTRVAVADIHGQFEGHEYNSGDPWIASGEALRLQMGRRIISIPGPYGVHPNAEGQQCIANVIWEVAKAGLGSSEAPVPDPCP